MGDDGKAGGRVEELHAEHESMVAARHKSFYWACL
jgi:hypothetical protein